MMNLPFKARFSRKWIFIICMIGIFIAGNMFLFKNWNQSDKQKIRPVDQYEWSKFVRQPDSKREQTEQDEIANGEEREVPELPNLEKNSHTEGEKDDSKLAMTYAKSKNDKELGPSEQKQHMIKEVSVSKDSKYRIAILVIACNRESVSKCLDQIYKYKPKNIDIPVIVSQDCGDLKTENVIKSYGNKLSLVKQPDMSDVKGVPAHMIHFMGYYKISRHYKFALKQVFRDPLVDSAIVIEDDLDIAPDFFEYFMATRPLLDIDKSLFCVSAWNDNGKEGFVKDNKLLYRSDFFPGLGWMLTKKLWLELEPKWPLGFWDDWMRNPDQRKNRACIRPEISRSKTFGRIGVSQGQFYDQYLKFIQLNHEFYPFRQADLHYLLKPNYDKDFVREVYKHRTVNAEDVLNDSVQEDSVRIEYGTNQEIESLTRQFGLMTDLKAGVPRTAYRGIVSFVRNGKRIYLTPPANWAGYSEN